MAGYARKSLTRNQRRRKVVVQKWLWRSVSDYRGNMVHLEARFDAVRLARYDSVEWFSA